MDLNNRSFRPAQQPGVQHNEPNAVSPSGAHHDNGGHKKRGKLGRVRTGGALNVTYIFLLFSVTVVLVGVLLTLIFFKNTSSEERFVDESKYQAIFLNNGQVYFGNINELNKDYLRMSNIYYLRVNQQVQPDQQAAQNDVSLVKLGCELHGPEDSMTVNRDQITFWENLKGDGQVAKAVAEYQKANPNGQNCEQQQGSTTNPPASNDDKASDDQSSSSNDENSNSSNTPTTNP